MKADVSYFIGYGKLEDLLAAHADPVQPFFVELMTQRYPGSPVGRAELLILVQAFDEEGRVRYCRIPCGSYALFQDGPFDVPKALGIHAQSMENTDRILDTICSRGFRFERASIAFPKDLILLNGSADLLHPDERRGEDQGQRNCYAPPSDKGKVSL